MGLSILRFAGVAGAEGARTAGDRDLSTEIGVHHRPLLCNDTPRGVGICCIQYTDPAAGLPDLCRAKPCPPTGQQLVLDVAR